MLYTDGLVEVEHEVIAGTRRLEEAVLAIQRRIFAQREPHDDSAVLFIGTAPVAPSASPERQVWEFDAADEAAAARVKRAFLWRLAGFGSREWDLAAIESIYPPFSLDGVACPDLLAESGRGLFMIQALAVAATASPSSCRASRSKHPSCSAPHDPAERVSSLPRK